MKANLLSKAVMFTCCLALFGLSSELKAQTKPRGGTPEAQPAGPQYELEIQDGTIRSKAVEGMAKPSTLANAVEVLRLLNPDYNIAMAPELRDVELTDLKVHATTIQEELEALRVASGNRFLWVHGTPSSVSAVDPATGQPVSGGAGGGIGGGPQPTPYAVAVAPGSAPAAAVEDSRLFSLFPDRSGASASGRAVEVFNLSGYLPRAKNASDRIAEIEKMIVETSDAVNGSQARQMSFQFHPGANLLIVIGSPGTIEVARRVVGAMVPSAVAAAPGMPTGPFPYANGAFLVAGAGTPDAAVLAPESSAPSSEERNDILNKLDSIRLDSVQYDNLPLSEVVRNLLDESKKRDPAKQGVNFVINPNPPASPPGAPNQPSQETVDINSVTIRIVPHLSNVRLVDVLDAIVRVADHPIRYTVTDYAVVFSLAAPEMPPVGAPAPGVRR